MKRPILAIMLQMEIVLALRTGPIPHDDVIFANELNELVQLRLHRLASQIDKVLTTEPVSQIMLEELLKEVKRSLVQYD